VARVVLPKKSVIVAAPDRNVRPAAADRPAAKKRPAGDEPPVPSEADLPRHVAKLEKDLADLKKAFGMSEAEFQTQGVCPHDGLTGEVTGEDRFSSRRYVHYRDKKGHEWFDELKEEAQ
jgi:hypothetical protein